MPNKIDFYIDNLTLEIREVRNVLHKSISFFAPSTFVKKIETSPSKLYTEIEKTLPKYHKESIQPLLTALENTQDSNRRLCAAFLLATIKINLEQAYVLPLIKTLSDLDREVSYWSLQALKKVQPTSDLIINALFETALAYSNILGREATLALAQIGEVAVVTLINGLQSNNKQVRYKTANIIKYFGTDAIGALPYLIIALSAASESEKIHFQAAIKSIMPKASIVVDNLDTDPNAALDMNSSIILSQKLLDLEFSLPQILVVAKNSSAKTRLAALSILNEQIKFNGKSDEIIRVFIEALNDEDYEVRKLAIYGLGHATLVMVAPHVKTRG